MLDFSKVTYSVKNWFKNLFNKPILSSCAHTFVFLDQVWEKTATKKFILKNRYGCNKCNGFDVRDIGA